MARKRRYGRVRVEVQAQICGACSVRAGPIVRCRLAKPRCRLGTARDRRHCVSGARWLCRHLTDYGDYRHNGGVVADPDVESFLPLPASVMHIVVALASGDKHGYAIMRDVAELSGGTVRIGSGTLYGAIGRMLNQGLIEEAEQRPDPMLDDERRRYYRLTDLGHRVGAAEHRRLSALVDAGRLRQLGIMPGGVG